MKKVLLIIGVSVVVLVGGGISYLHIKSAQDKPKPLIACAEQESTSVFMVRKGCEPSEKTNLDEVATLLERLPAEFAANDSTSLVAEADAGALQKALPAKSKIMAYLDSWRRTGSIASMDIKVTKTGIIPSSQKFKVVFSHTENGWKLLQTTAAMPR
jgi:hypothetical protein